MTETKKKKTPNRPSFWPKRRNWPPSKNRHVIEIINTFPPTYILDDGTSVLGQWNITKK